MEKIYSNKNVFSTFGSLNQEGYEFFKDLFRRNCDSLAQERCVYMPLLWQKLSIILHKENFNVMSRRFRLSHELSYINTSTMDRIPETNQIEMDQSIPLQSVQKQNLDLFLKERLEESNMIFENLGKTSKSSQDDLQELEVDTRYSNSFTKYQSSRIVTNRVD